MENFWKGFEKRAGLMGWMFGAKHDPIGDHADIGFDLNDLKTMEIHPLPEGVTEGWKKSLQLSGHKDKEAAFSHGTEHFNSNLGKWVSTPEGKKWGAEFRRKAKLLAKGDHKRRAIIKKQVNELGLGKYATGPVGTFSRGGSTPPPIPGAKPQKAEASALPGQGALVPGINKGVMKNAPMSRGM